ncbi:MAG: hypothetical protein ACOCUR_01615 [Nanoarchaeota archaeon]
MDDERKVNKVNIYPKIPKVPRNYIMTEYGLMPNPEISDAVREIYSNYFMVQEKKYGDTQFYFDGTNELMIYIEEVSDYENPEDKNAMKSIAEVSVIMQGGDKFDQFCRDIENVAENNSYGLEARTRFQGSNRYRQGDFSLDIETYETIRPQSFFSYETIEELHTTISREKERENILDTMENCFLEMAKYRPVFERHGIDWDEAENGFYMIGYDNDFIFKYRYSETPRDFWETAEETWKRMDEKQLNDVIDTNLKLLFENKHNEERKKEIKHSLKIASGFLNRLYDKN